MDGDDDDLVSGLRLKEKKTRNWNKLNWVFDEGKFTLTPFFSRWTNYLRRIIYLD